MIYTNIFQLLQTS